MTPPQTLHDEDTDPHLSPGTVLVVSVLLNSAGLLFRIPATALITMARLHGDAASVAARPQQFFRR